MNSPEKLGKRISDFLQGIQPTETAEENLDESDDTVEFNSSINVEDVEYKVDNESTSDTHQINREDDDKIIKTINPIPEENHTKEDSAEKGEQEKNDDEKEDDNDKIKGTEESVYEEEAQNNIM